jgi:phosphohistidine swiveling domain-containing protein
MNGEYILPLTGSSASEATLERVGGKAASLARLIEGGLPVPGGFVVSTAAYARFVEENELGPQIKAALAANEPARPSSLETASRTIGDAFADASIPDDVADAVAGAYLAFEGSPAVAVRSSATAEDLPGLSFAGQQETYLNVRGGEAVQAAVVRCWASLWTARAIGYRARHAIDQGAVRLAVVVQRLVAAEAAGIMFTANPVNGRRDEVAINAAWGLGEAVVGGEVSPDTIVADKETGEVKEVATGDKAVMTVPAPHGTALQPVDPARREARVLDDAQVRELVRLGGQVEALYGTPQDVEWCWAEGQFYILQSRPITTLDATPSPGNAEAPGTPDSSPATCHAGAWRSDDLPGNAEAQGTPGSSLATCHAGAWRSYDLPGSVPPPSEWKGPNPKARYLRNNIVELIPDPMTPLFATLGRRTINERMSHLMAEYLGRSGLISDEIVIPIHGYAYYNGEFSRGAIGWILLHSVGIMRRMLTGAIERWHKARANYKAAVAEWQARPWRTLSTTEILDAVPAVLGEAIDYYVACVSGLIPAAWISEGLFTIVYKALIRRRGDPGAATYLLGFDSVPIRGEKALYDLATWARARLALADLLPDTPTDQLVAQVSVSPRGPSVMPVPVTARDDWEEWCTRFRAYLVAYGATVYDLDFEKPTPADDPAPTLGTFKLFLRGEGSDPYARQAAAAERRERATQEILERLHGLRLRLFRTQLARAQKYAPLREDGLADIGWGYPLLRQMLLEVGRRLAEAGAINVPDDVFWLVEEQVRVAAAAVDAGQPAESMAGSVEESIAVVEARKRVSPPAALPLPPKFLRRLLPGQFGVEPGEEQAPDIIRGVACSAGSVTATARVLDGPEAFDQMEPGEVLVAAITTPAWTPLFAMASAIVTDVGGPLSHGSIVAREYGIPAVLGTGVATRRLHTGDLVRVDGSSGTIEILERGTR